MPRSISVDLDRPTISVDDFAAVMGVSRSSAFAAVRAGEVPHVRLGRRIRIPSASVRRMLRVDEPNEAV
jgi:excisionase family DNA binding protein